MSFWKKIFYSSAKPKVKKQYILGEYVIVLLKDQIADSDGQSSNIAAYDSSRNLKWVAEKPYREFAYYDMQVDEDNNTVIGDSGAGTVYTIGLEDGKIISSELIK